MSHRQLFYSTLARHKIYAGVSIFLLVSPLACDSAKAGFWGGGQFNIVLKADVQDSLEALTEALTKIKNFNAKISTDEVRVNIIASGVGAKHRKSRLCPVYTQPFKFSILGHP